MTIYVKADEFNYADANHVDISTNKNPIERALQTEILGEFETVLEAWQFCEDAGFFEDYVSLRVLGFDLCLQDVETQELWYYSDISPRNQALREELMEIYAKHDLTQDNKELILKHIAYLTIQKDEWTCEDESELYIDGN